MVKNWIHWCRLCAKEDLSNNHINVFLEDEKGLGLSNIIKKWFSIDINYFNEGSHMEWSHMICAQCFFLIKSIIDLTETASKVQDMFSELQDCDNDLDVYEIKERYDYELNKFSVNDFDENVAIEVTEQMVGVDELENTYSNILNTTEIRTQIKDENYINKFDRILTPYEENSDEDYFLKSDDLSLDINPMKKKQKREIPLTHKNQSIQNNKIQCEKCPKNFYRVQFHRRHMEKAHGIILEAIKPTKPLDFVCEECGKKCRSNSALRDHQISHSSERTLKCAHCEKLFKNKKTLKTHEEIHSDTNYICVVCGLQLKTRGTLQMHKIVHSDQKRHKCNICGKEYKRNKALKCHLIIHTGLKPYTCDFCDKKFANDSNCRSHKKKSHPVELAAMEAAGQK